MHNYFDGNFDCNNKLNIALQLLNIDEFSFYKYSKLSCVCIFLISNE